LFSFSFSATVLYRESLQNQDKDKNIILYNAFDYTIHFAQNQVFDHAEKVVGTRNVQNVGKIEKKQKLKIPNVTYFLCSLL